MNKEIMQKARKLSETINDAKVDMEILDTIEIQINDGDTAHLTTQSSHQLLDISPDIALRLLREEKPRLEAKLEKLEKEYEDL